MRLSSWSPRSLTTFCLQGAQSLWSQRTTIAGNRAAELTGTDCQAQILCVQGEQEGCVFDTCLGVQITEVKLLPLSFSKHSPMTIDHVFLSIYCGWNILRSTIILLLFVFSSCGTYQPDKSPLCTLKCTCVLFFPWTFAPLLPFFMHPHFCGCLWFWHHSCTNPSFFLHTLLAALSGHFCHSTKTHIFHNSKFHDQW